MNRLIVENLSAGYGAVSVLRNVSLEVNENEMVALLGMNGNGKSTLLNCVLGFVRASAGRILLEWDGKVSDLTKLPPHEIVRLGLSIVPEGRRLVPNISVEDNLRLAGSNPLVSGRMKENLASCFETFPLLLERRRQIAATMSGGQQQLLAIARSLMTAPKIMVIDEPSVGLAPIVVRDVLNAITHLRERSSMTILMAEQSFFQAVDISSRAYVLAHGSIHREFKRSDGGIANEDIRRAMLGTAH